MKTKRSLIPIWLLGAVVLALPAVVQAQFTYTTNNGTITLTGYTGSGGAVTIPGTINSLPVTSIGVQAFYQYYSLTNVTIPNSVTNIAKAAFYDCTNLTSVYFQGNAPSLASTSVFSGDTATVYYLPGTTGWGSTFGGLPTAIWIQFTYTTNNGTITLTGYTGSGSAVTIPGTITGLPVISIGSNTFYQVSSLTSVTIPNGVTNIGNFAFAHCTSLTNVMIPNSVTSIGTNAFYDCTSLTGVIIPDSVTSIGTLTFYDCTSLTNVIIPDSVTSIGTNAFYDCSSLTSVMFGTNVTSIGDDAFADCSSLTSLYFQGNAPSADSTVFSGDTATVYYLPGTTGWGSTFGGLPTAIWIQFTYTTNNGTITITGYNGPGGAVTIPGTITGLPVTSIGNNAFYQVSTLTSVTILNSVTNIGADAFYDCASLTNVTIGTSVTSIGADAFYDCASLTSVTIGTSVASIGDYAFYDCASLASVTIPNSVTSIGNFEFYGCASLTNVMIGTGVTSIGADAFADCFGLTSVTIPNSVTSMGKGVFYDCTNLTSIVIGNGITSSPENAFYDCTSLTSVYFQGNAPSADCTVFSGDNNATVYYLPGTTGWGSTFACVPTELFSYIFTIYNDTITITGYDGPGGAVTIPDTIDGLPVTSIGSNAFYQVSSLTSVTIPNSVTTLGNFAFANCTSLTNIMIGTSVTSIGTNAFYDCTSLPSVTIPDKVTSIGTLAFYDCSSLTSVTIGTNVTSIGADAFADCSSLTSLYFQGNAPSADSTVFSGDTATVYYLPGTTGWGSTFAGLPTAIWIQFTYTTNNGTITITGYTGSGGAVTIPGTISGLPVTSIGNNAFYQVSTLTSVTIPNSVTSIGDDAFYDCASLTAIYFQGNAPSADSTVFLNDNNVTVYYLPGTTGWGSTFGGVPTALFPFTFTINNDTITITGYNGSGGAVTIPGMVTSLPVTSIGTNAFYQVSGMTSVTIPNSVTNIGDDAFADCTSLTAIYFQGNAPSADSTVFSGDNNVTVYYLLGATGWGSTFVGLPTALWYPPVPCAYTINNGTITITEYLGSSGAVTIPSTINGYPVTSIGTNAFYQCSSLTSVTIPNSVTNIGDDAFYDCTSLTAINFQGNAPNADSTVFSGDNNATVYYLPGTTGWGSTFGGVPTALFALPTGWTDQDIGAPGQAGSASVAAKTGVWTVSGGGAAVGGTSDQFNFAAQNFAGDGSVVACVTSVQNTAASANSGVMFRDSTNANAAYAFVFVTSGTGVWFQWRSADGSSAGSSGSVSGITAPVWLKLVRVGNNFAGYYSLNGLNWTPLGTQTISMAGTSKAGLAVCANNNSLLNTSTFGGVYVAAATNLPSAQLQRVNLAKFQSVTSDSAAPGMPASFVTDGIVGNANAWQSSGAGSHWVAITLPLAMTLGSAQLYLGSDDTSPIVNFSLQYWNGSSWVTIPGASFSGNTATVLNVVFSSPVTTSQVRLYSTDATVTVREIALFGPNNPYGYAIGTDVTLNVAKKHPVTVSSTDGLHYGQNAEGGYAGNDYGWWQSANVNGPHTLYVNLLTTTRIGSVHLYSGSSTAPAVADFTLQSWNGSAWVNIPGGTVSNNTLNDLVVRFPPVATSQVGLSISDNGAQVVRQLAVFAASTGITNYPIGTDVVTNDPPTTVWENFSDSFYQILNQNNGNALVASGSGASQTVANGADLTQQFQILYNYDSDTYRIRNRATWQCLAATNAGDSVGTGVVLENEYYAMPHELWRLQATGGGYYRIVNVWNGLALQTDGQNPATVTLQPQSADAHQQWQLNFQANYPQKGLADYNNNWAQMQLSWVYNWGLTPPASYPASVVYCPMAWSGANVPDLPPYYSAWRMDAGPKILFGFNEPDNSGQSDMTVASAASFWPQLMASDLPLLSPAPDAYGDGWLYSFYNTANTNGYRVDFTGVHTYGGYSASSLISYLQSAYTQWGRPVMLTEFGNSGDNFTEEQNYQIEAEFMWGAAGLSWLQRYSFFPWYDGESGNIPAEPWDGEALNYMFYTNATSTLTALGEFYAAWDGDTNIHPNTAYMLQDKATFFRIGNSGSTSPITGNIRVSDSTMQWVLVASPTTNQWYLVSVHNGSLLSWNGSTLSLAPAGTTGAAVQWTYSADPSSTYGYFFIANPATGNRLRMDRTPGSGAPTSITLSMDVPGAVSDNTRWRFIMPVQPATPGVPTGLSATAAVAQVTLNWNAASGAIGYNVKSSTTSGGPYTTVTNVATTSYVNTGLTNGTTYYYVVSAVGSVVEGANSSQVSATPQSSSQPIIGNITISGLNLVISGTNGTAGTPFYVLWSTNLTLPLSNWTTISTNQFGPGGGFSITNMFNPSMQHSFYLIEVP